MSKKHHGATGSESLAAVLQSRLGGRVLNLRVRVEEGGVILQGQAITYYVKQLAQHAAMEETNMPIRANEIEVR